MDDEAVTEVGINEEGALYVRPSHTAFEHIYRAAREVQWDAERKLLLTPKPREWSYARWFEQIISAAAKEYGVRLRLTPSTIWSNVPPDLKAAISEACR